MDTNQCYLWCCEETMRLKQSVSRKRQSRYHHLKIESTYSLGHLITKKGKKRKCSSHVFEENINDGWGALTAVRMAG